MASYPLPKTGRVLALVGAFALALGGAGATNAQSMGANSAQYNSGYGGGAAQGNQPVNASMRDANGNLVVAGGRLLSPMGGSVFSSSTSGGVGSSATGVGAGASAVGNSLSVVTTGSYNTVIINSKQTNTGAITATATTSGGVGNAQQ